MSRVFTIVVILLLMAVVALVPRIGTEEQGPDLGEGYAYREDTLARFRLLLEDEAWTLADPPRNPQGMLEAVHRKTRLVFVLIPAIETTARDRSLKASASKGLEDPGAFLLSKTEVTNAHYHLYCPEGQRLVVRVRRPDAPVFALNRKEVDRFVEWLSSGTVVCRLPTEAEWEYACAAGDAGVFPWGDDPKRLDEFAWHRQNTQRWQWDELPVGAKSPNRWGLHDMLGNAWEVTGDPWIPEVDMPPGEWPSRVAKGGAASTPSGDFSTSMRERRFPGHYVDTGVRPAANLPDPRRTGGD